MSLISLPSELLLDIADLLGEPTYHYLNDYYTLMDRRNCLALAATCRATRKVAVNVLYKHIVLDPNKAWIFSLHKNITSNPAAASSVRHLILVPPENRGLPGWSTPKNLFRCYRQILGLCSGIRTLLVTAHNGPPLHVLQPPSSSTQCIANTKWDKNMLNPPNPVKQTGPSWNDIVGIKRDNYAYAFWRKPGNNTTRLLSTINIHSQKKIEHIEFREMSTRQLLSHIQRLVGFTGLETFLITDCHIEYLNSEKVEDLLGLDLPSILSVKILSIKMQDTHLFQSDEVLRGQEHKIGTLFASAFPDIRTFTLHATESITYGALHRYTSVGNNLTHLTICPGFSISGDTHLCGLLSTLSSSLTHLTISRGNKTSICHKLFAGEWKCLKKLAIYDCRFPCHFSNISDGLEQLRINLLHLLNLKPAAAITILGSGMSVACDCDMSTKIVWKEQGKKEYFICESMFDEPSDDESGSESMLDGSIEFIPFTGGFGWPGGADLF